MSKLYYQDSKSEKESISVNDEVVQQSVMINAGLNVVMNCNSLTIIVYRDDKGRYELDVASAGDRAHLYLDISVINAGEDAHATVLTVQLPTSVVYTGSDSEVRLQLNFLKLEGCKHGIPTIFRRLFTTNH